MRVILCRHAGFCYGVRRAMDIALRAAKQREGRIFTLGPLVHNSRAAQKLIEAGIIEERDSASIQDGLVIIPSHGVSPFVIEEIGARGLQVVDATCPYVKRAQELASRLASEGYEVLIVGDPGHAEVLGLLGWARGKGTVVRNSQDLGLVRWDKVGVVVQTTQTGEVVRDVAGALAASSKESRIFNTICKATEERQRSARDLARKIGTVIVVGDERSANTRRLVEVCQEAGARTFLVEGADDIDGLPLAGVPDVGVTAGASTPNWVIEEVVLRMKESKDVEEVQGEQASTVVESQEQEAVGEPLKATDEPQEVISESQEVEAVSDSQEAVGELPGIVEAEEREDVDREAETGDDKAESLSPADGEKLQVEEVIEAGESEDRDEPDDESGEDGKGKPEAEAEGEAEASGEEAKDEEEASAVPSLKKGADIDRAWERIIRAFQSSEIIEAPVTDVVKGGLSVDVGVRGFVPASQVGRRRTDLGNLVGMTLRLKVLEADRSRNNVVLSSRIVEEEEQVAVRARALATIKQGDILEGLVKRVVDFGAFVDVGEGVEGLLHVRDMSWGRNKNPREIVSEGDRVKIMVLGIDRERQRISLGLKQTQSDPWDEVPARYPVGTVTTGVVTNVTDFGAFIQLEEGVEGLVHVSQLANRRVNRPEDIVNVGDEVTVKVVSVRQADRRIGLSIKEVEADREKRDSEKFMERRDENPTIGEVFGGLFDKETKETNSAEAVEEKVSPEEEKESLENDSNTETGGGE